jgi:sugar transferase (PEP-CTERM/EpsH1 system associated)
MNILYVTPYVPSRIRTRPFHLIRALLALGHRVTLVTAAISEEEKIDAAALRDWGIEVDVFRVPKVRSAVNCLGALVTGEPLQAAYAYHPQMARRIRQRLAEEPFDVVHIEHLRAAQMVEAVDGVPTVYDSVDCISLLFEKTLKTSPEWRPRLRARIDLRRTRRYEAQLCTQYGQIVITSRKDKEALEELARRYPLRQGKPAPITVVANGVDLEYFQPTLFDVPRDEKTLIFTGKMSYHANVASVVFFARDILPLIWEKEPDVRFQIVGKDPPEVVQALAVDDRIEVTGTVEDLRPYLAQAAVSVCPAVYAVGIQNKILEAMAMDAPVVCTAAASSSLEATLGKEILVADASETFASLVVRVLNDPVLAEELGTNGRRYVERQHSWEAAASELVRVYGQT